MSELGYGNPGSLQDLKVFTTNLTLKRKEELLLILSNIASACDMEGKGYVSEWESVVRHALGYTRGTGLVHSRACRCLRCKEQT